MPLRAPELDTQDFEGLLRQLQLRVPRYLPEWTDFNESDPGNTLLQLFAWLTEMLLFRMNQVPERNYVKFLELLDVKPAPARPATAYLTFVAQERGAALSVLPRTPIGAQPPEGGPPLAFETVEGLDLIRAPLAAVQVYDGSSFAVVTQANEEPGPEFRPLGWVPQVGSALYLGFAVPEGAGTGPAPAGLFPSKMRFRVFLPAVAPAVQAGRCDELARPPAPPVTLQWEYRSAEDAPPGAAPTRWRRLAVFKDESIAFTREGDVVVQGPARAAPTVEGAVPGPSYWLRVRVIRGVYPAGGEPVIDFIRPNTVAAENLSTVREEVVATGEDVEGVPNEAFELRRKPVQPDSLVLTVQETGQEPKVWTRVEDFLASGRDSEHYVLDAVDGRARFGDGERGRIPTVGAEVVAREYRHGGGKAGNVGAGLVKNPLTALPGVKEVTNPRPAEGGQDSEDVEDLKKEAPRFLRCRGRAVTVEDFAALAVKAGGVARATVLPQAHPDFSGVVVPGAVTVVIVPDTDDRAPEPSPALLAHVCRFLDGRRLVTTEVYLKGPDYQRIRVTATVEAQPYAAFDQVKYQVIEALNRYLDPLGRKPGPRPAGAAPARVDRPRGWGFGQKLYPTNLFSVILGVTDVVAVTRLGVDVNDRPHDDLSQPVIVGPAGLVYGAADHDLTVIPAEDR